MGDFNALSTSEEISILKKGGFIDTYAAAGKLPGYTWDELNNTNINKYQKNDSSVTRSRIDYILIRGSGLRVTDSRVVLNRSTYGVHPSDHFGVLTRINVLSVDK